MREKIISHRYKGKSDKSDIVYQLRRAEAGKTMQVKLEEKSRFQFNKGLELLLNLLGLRGVVHHIRGR